MTAGTTATPTGVAGLDRIVVVGASLAGLRAAEALRDEGYAGHLTVVGAEDGEPYDRPPLSKAVLAGRTASERTVLPRTRATDAKWISGVAAAGLDRRTHEVTLADGRSVGYDRLLICTGTRDRSWPDPAEAALDGVFGVRTASDAAALRERLSAAPRRVLVVGGGFIGSEVASACRELGLPVTLVEHGTAPMVGALGGAAGTVTSRLQRVNGVDLRCETAVMSLEGDRQGRLVGARLSDGDRVQADVAVVALGAVRNVEWLSGSALAVDRRGVVCDAACRVFDAAGMVTDDVFVAGDVARWPHPLYDGQLLAVEHWGNAVAQARTAAHNMVCAPQQRRAHAELPTFWSNQFGVTIKSVGLASYADEVMVVQGSVRAFRFVAAYGRAGRIVAAVSFNAPRALDIYQEMIRTQGTFPPPVRAADPPDISGVVPVALPPREVGTHSATATVTGPGPSSPAPANDVPPDPRIPPGVHPL